MKPSATSLHFFQNVARLSSPDERFRIIVVGVNVPPDSTGDIVYVLKDPATKAVYCEIAEEAFDHVKPRSTCRSEVGLESRITLEPSFDLFVLMGGVIVTNDIDVFSVRNIAADQVEKANPFLPLVACTVLIPYDDPSGLPTNIPASHPLVRKIALQFPNGQRDEIAFAPEIRPLHLSGKEGRGRAFLLRKGPMAQCTVELGAAAAALPTSAPATP